MAEKTPAAPPDEEALTGQIEAALTATAKKLQPQFLALAKIWWPGGWQAPTDVEMSVWTRPIGGNTQTMAVSFTIKPAG